MIVDPAVLPLFILSAFLVMIIPGADMVLIVANTLSGGKKSGVISALGITTGALLHFIAAALGISAVILASDTAYDVIRMLGAGYLAWIGFQYLTTKSTLGSLQVMDSKPSVQIFRQGILTNLLNPKAILFNLSFVPQFVSLGYGAVWAQILIFGAILIIIGISVNLLMVVMSSQLSSLMRNKPSNLGMYFEKAAGVVLIILAVYVAVSRRPVQ